MNVAQTQDSSALFRQKQNLRDTASKDEARADQLTRDAAKDHFTADERAESAAENRQNAEALSKQSQKLRRNGREQSQRGLERLADGSDRISEAFVGTERGLEELKGSLGDLESASATKNQGLETAKEGLSEQATENAIQGAQLEQFGRLQEKDARLDLDKAHQSVALRGNVEQRERGLERQSSDLDSFLIAGESFAQGTATKAEGFEHLKSATGHTVEAEALGDARDAKKLTQSWAEADQVRHEDTSQDLQFSALWHSLKSKTAALQADHFQKMAAADNASAEGLSAQSSALKAQAGQLLQQARCLEQAGQSHIAIGRQLQCCPWTYCQGVALERQGCAEVAQARQMKAEASRLRTESQQLALQAEELRTRAEDAQARGEEFEVKSFGDATRSENLKARSHEHADKSEKAGKTAQKANAQAAALEQAAQTEKETAQEFQSQGLSRLNAGFVQQDEALGQQKQTGRSFGEELEIEADLTSQSRDTVGEAKDTIGRELSLLGRSGRLLHQVGRSHRREEQAQAKVAQGIDGLESGLATSETAQQRGVEATKMLEEARELELEGLRLQNRGQKMLLEARPKMVESARLSAESFDASLSAQRQEEEATRLIESGHQKLSAAAILRDKASNYRKIATE